MGPRSYLLTFPSGVCVCSLDYAGVDCSQLADVIPHNVALPVYGLCDVRYQNCSVIVVYGNSFIDGDDLTCNLQQVRVGEILLVALRYSQNFSFQIVHNETIFEGESYLVRGVFSGFQEVRCIPKKLGSYLVSVSNNRLNFSDTQLFVQFDSVCFVCKTDSVAGAHCFRKVILNSCVICTEILFFLLWNLLQVHFHVMFFS